MIIYNNEGLFIDEQKMNDVKKHSKKAYFLDYLRTEMPRATYRSIMSDFHKTKIYEIEPILQLDGSWLNNFFGFKGQLFSNIGSHGVDAMFLSEDQKQKRSIELKMFTTQTKDTRTPYHNGFSYWDLKSKSWKFRPKQIEDANGNKILDANGKPKETLLNADTAICMIVNSDNDDLVEAIGIEQENMLPILHSKKQAIMNCQRSIRYADLNQFDHMIGNKSPARRNELLVATAKSTGVVSKKKSSKYYKFGDEQIGTNHLEVANWLRDNKTITQVVWNDPQVKTLYK